MSSATSYEKLSASESSLPTSTAAQTPTKPSQSRARKLLAVALITMLALASMRPLVRSCMHGARGRGMSSAIKLSPNEISYKLPSGDKIPSVALGTWQAEPGQVGDAVTTALKEVCHILARTIAYQISLGDLTFACLCRATDTSTGLGPTGKSKLIMSFKSFGLFLNNTLKLDCFRNEAEVGSAIKKSGVDRKDLWITSKVSLKALTPYEEFLTLPELFRGFSRSSGMTIMSQRKLKTS